MQGLARSVLTGLGWVFLVAGLALDLASCIAVAASRLRQVNKSPILVVPAILYAIGLAALGKLYFRYPFVDFAVLVGLHLTLQLLVPAAVARMRRQKRQH